MDSLSRLQPVSIPPVGEEDINIRHSLWGAAVCFKRPLRQGERERERERERGTRRLELKLAERCSFWGSLAGLMLSTGRPRVYVGAKRVWPLLEFKF